MNPSCLLRAQELTCQMPTFDSGGKRMTYKHKTAAAAVRAFSPYHSHLAPIVITKGRMPNYALSLDFYYPPLIVIRGEMV